MTVKTDNGNFPAKLTLRRYFLDKYHSNGDASVFDACQGGGILWKTLRRDFTVANYWGVDEKPKKGRIKIDSVRILSQPGWPQNVIDIDTYGSPWSHWFAMLPHITIPISVFLTIGDIDGRPTLSRHDLELMGFPNNFLLHMPRILTRNFNKIAMQNSISISDDFGIRIVEAKEASTESNVGATRYIGIRLEPAETAV